MGMEFQSQKKQKRKAQIIKLAKNTTYFTYCSVSCLDNVSLHMFEFKLLWEIRLPAASPYTDLLLS